MSLDVRCYSLVVGCRGPVVSAIRFVGTALRLRCTGRSLSLPGLVHQATTDVARQLRVIFRFFCISSPIYLHLWPRGKVS